MCDAIEGRAASEEDVSNRTGLVLDPYFSATKVAWILDNVPGARAQAERGELAFGTVDSWLIWHLTSGHRHVTDVTNASRTLLYNIVKGEWDAELLRIFNIPASLLPEVVWSSQKVGEVTTTLGLGGIPIAGIAGDQQAALFGQLCWARARPRTPTEPAASCCRTSAPSLCAQRTGSSPPWPPAHRQRLEYAFEGSIFIGGRGGAVAARQPQAHWLFGRGGDAGRQRARYRRRGVCAGLCGAGRAALGSACGRPAHRAASRHPAGAHCTGGSREHCLPGGGRARSRGEPRPPRWPPCAWMAAPR